MRYLPRKVDSQFIVRILKNEIDAEEREFFDEWLQESDEHKELFANSAWMWDRMAEAKTPPEPDPDLLWSNVAQRIHACEVHPAASTRTRAESAPNVSDRLSRILNGLREDFLPKFAAYALAPVALVFIIVGIYSLYDSSRGVYPRAAEEVTAPVVHIREVITRRGQRATVPLADGTVVYLNAESRLRYPLAFSRLSRELVLEGEAYFAVAHDVQRPFRVTTGDATTEVKGTEFNVRYRKDNLNVVVSKGSVRVYDRNKQKSVDLRKGELASYSRAIGFTTPRKVDVRRYIAWRENKLSFVKTSLRDVMSEIELCYNVHVEFKRTPSRTNTLTGYFALDSLDEVLSSVALAMNVHIERNGQTIIVY